MVHSSEQALQVARAILEKNRIKHISVDAPREELNFQFLDSKLVTDAWVICYTYMVFQDEDAFIFLDDRNDLKLIYVLTKHDYVMYDQ
ncbi:hypothetical protein ACVWYN_002208 [Pedobacter sp. UYP24]